MKNNKLTLHDCVYIAVYAIVFTLLALYLIAILASVLGANILTRPDSAQDLLVRQGYRNIQITGYRVLMCGKGDIYSTGFRAISPSGHLATGAICEGVFKGSTIRFD